MWLTKLFALSAEEPTLWEELWVYFETTYFSVDLGNYEHLQIGRGSLGSLQSVVLGLFGGIVLAAAVAMYDKNRLGAFVRAIVKHECLSPEAAKTVGELGFARNGSVKASLRSRYKLGRVVRCVEREAYEQEVAERRAKYLEEHGSDKGFSMPEYRVNFETDRFYIPDEEHYRAEIRFENKGSSWRSFVLVVILSVIAAAAVCFLLPDMLQLVDNMIGILNK